MEAECEQTLNQPRMRKEEEKEQLAKTDEESKSIISGESNYILNFEYHMLSAELQSEPSHYCHIYSRTYSLQILSLCKEPYAQFVVTVNGRCTYPSEIPKRFLWEKSQLILICNQYYIQIIKST
jgi:hypothetical protein